MPKGTRVSRCVERLKRSGKDVNPYAICQASTKQSYATGEDIKEGSRSGPEKRKRVRLKSTSGLAKSLKRHTLRGAHAGTGTIRGKILYATILGARALASGAKEGKRKGDKQGREQKARRLAAHTVYANIGKILSERLNNQDEATISTQNVQARTLSGKEKMRKQMQQMQLRNRKDRQDQMYGAKF